MINKILNFKQNEFERYLEYKNLHENTRKLYFLLIQKYFTIYNDFNNENIYQFFKDMKSKNYSVGALNNFRNALLHYGNFSNIKVDLPDLLPQQEKVIDFITLEVLESQILPKVKEIFPHRYLKIKTLLYFMLYTGLRRNEHYNLKRSDIDLVNKRGKVLMDKTNREKVFFINGFMSQLLQEYFNSEEEKENAFNLEKNAIDYIFRKLQPYFPNIHLRPHLFRHGFGTMLNKERFNIKEIAILLGHRSLRSTKRYVSFDIENIAEKYNNVFK